MATDSRLPGGLHGGYEVLPGCQHSGGPEGQRGRYLKNKHAHVFTVDTASDSTETIDWVHRILKAERDIVIGARPLETTAFVTDLRAHFVIKGKY